MMCKFKAIPLIYFAERSKHVGPGTMAAAVLCQLACPGTAVVTCLPESLQQQQAVLISHAHASKHEHSCAEHNFVLW